MDRPGFCKGCQSCITPCKRNDMNDEEILEEFFEEFLDTNNLTIGIVINVLIKISVKRIKAGL